MHAALEFIPFMKVFDFFIGKLLNELQFLARCFGAILEELWC
jgi:hypothetical protein